MKYLSLIDFVVSQVELFLEPIEYAVDVSPPWGFIEFCENYDINLLDVLVDTEEVKPILFDIKNILSSIDVLGSKRPFTTDDLIEYLMLFDSVTSGLDSFKGLSFKSGVKDEFKDIGRRLLDSLTTEYLIVNQESAFAFLMLIGALEDEKIKWDAIKVFFNEPLDGIKSNYNWAGTDFRHELLISNVYKLLRSIGVRSYFALNPNETDVSIINADLEDGFLERSLNIPFFQASNGGEYLESGLSLYSVTDDEIAKSVLYSFLYGKGGLVGSMNLGEDLTFTYENKFNSDGDFGLKISPQGIEVISLSSPRNTHGDLKVGFRKQGSLEAPILTFTIFSSILVLKELSFDIGANIKGDSIDVFFDIDFKDILFKIGVDDTDSFLKEALPKNENQISFDVGLIFSSKRGLFFKDGQGLEVAIPGRFNIMGVQVKRINAKLCVDFPLFKISMGFDLASSLGPISFIVEEIETSIQVDFDEKFDLSLNLFSPNGIGLFINTATVKGGGFINFYPDKGEYNGIFELTIKEKISIKVLGLLQTKMPDGSDGFSLLLIVMAEFTPIQLGFGFTLNGVGGLVGVNRTIAIEALRDGVRTGATDSILFPNDPVANAPQIIADLQSIFPVEEGRYTFGLMGKLGFGTPTLITLEMGLIIEVPDPVRLAIVGVLRAILPEEKTPILTLQVNFVGTIDFEQQFITFDASLFNSKLLNWTLSGDMAVRIKGGDNANFVFTVGGFHPDYTPPPLGLPRLRRLTISLLSGTNPRLTMESYFAVTSNTAQFGSRVDFYYKVTKKIYVSGWLGFDALFQFSPFYFRTDFYAGLAVYHKKKSILSINLTVFLEGPTPWHAKGEASFKVLFIKCKVKFDKTWGKKENKTLPPKEVYPLLRDALEEPANWEPFTLPQSRTSVTLRSLEAGEKGLIIRPDSTLGVLQKVVPLSLKLDKFGQHAPADYDHFELEFLDEEDNVLSSERLREQFAPSQFFATNSGDLLSLPNFEKQNAGIKLLTDDSGGLEASTFSERDVVYEQEIIDSQDEVRRLTFEMTELLRLNPAYYNTWVQGGATSRSALAVGNAARQQFVADKVELVRDAFVVADVETGALYDTKVVTSMAAAREILKVAEGSYRGGKERYTIIPENEMAF